MTASFVLTYDSLVTTIEQYLERNDAAVVDQIPVFITLAEFEIAQQIKTLGQIEVAQGVMSIGNPIIQKPARWRKTVSMSVTSGGEKTPVFLRKYEYLTNYSAESANGLPLYYADYDYDNWFVSPSPDQAYAFEVLIYQRLQPLSSTNQTNWITNNAPNAMLFGALQVRPSSVLRRMRMRISSQSLTPVGRFRASHQERTVPLAVTMMPGI